MDTFLKDVRHSRGTTLRVGPVSDSIEIALYGSLTLSPLPSGRGERSWPDRALVEYHQADRQVHRVSIWSDRPVLGAEDQAVLRRKRVLDTHSADEGWPGWRLAACSK